MAWTAGDYAGPLGDVIRVAKNGRSPAMLQTVGRHLARLVRSRVPCVDVIVPVPSARWRTAARGFSPAWVLAHELGRALGVPVSPLLMRRGRGGQRGRDATARMREVRREIRCRDGIGAVPRRVLLVDDVLTTGATAGACAEELLGLGARRVFLVAATTTKLKSSGG